MRGAWGPGMVCALAVGLAGCGRYSEFTMPPVSGGDAALSFSWDAAPGPVLDRGAAWESGDVLNPSVVRGPAGYLNLYSGFDGRVWRTGAAVSGDGLRWEKRGAILEPDGRTWEGSYIAANGSALRFGGRYWYWYQAGPKDNPRIGLATCPETADCTRSGGWSREPRPVLDYGPYASWDERAVADPYVVRAEPYFYMFYLGQDRARRQRLGVARSRGGIQWEKLRSNPVLELGGPGAFDENGLGEPAVWNSHGFYWMLYTGRDAGENRAIGLARSTDGVNWSRLPAVFHGAEAWDSKVICDPAVLLAGPEVRVWFGGGDVASPDERLNGQIGYAVLRSVKEAR